MIAAQQIASTVFKTLRTEVDPFQQILNAVTIQQQRHLQSKRELEAAVSSCQKLLPFHRKAIGAKKAIAATYATSDWLDVGRGVPHLHSDEPDEGEFF